MTDGNDLPNTWMRMQIGEFPSTQRNKLVILQIMHKARSIWLEMFQIELCQKRLCHNRNVAGGRGGGREVGGGDILWIIKNGGKYMFWNHKVETNIGSIFIGQETRKSHCAETKLLQIKIGATGQSFTENGIRTIMLRLHNSARSKW